MNIASAGESILSFPLEFASFTSLGSFGCLDFVSFPNRRLCAQKLSMIVIRHCKRLNSLPKRMHTLLPSLEFLQLKECPELKSFLEGCLPLSLKTLWIFFYDKLISHHMEWGLQSLHFLRDFRIQCKCKELVSFPKEMLLPHNLSNFHIYSFPNLKSLNYKGFQQLTSLKS